ncbi:MAG: GNAT family N-acetyltransferase [Fimbriimonas sp.]
MEKVIETPRLILRPLALSDLAWMHEMACDPEVMEFLTPSFALPVDDSETRIGLEKSVALYLGSRYGFFAADERESGDTIGWFILRPALDFRFATEARLVSTQIELGYRFRRSFWGNGYATEGAHALFDYAALDVTFDEYVAFTLVTNLRSCRVMERIGMKPQYEWEVPGFEAAGIVYSMPLR